MAGVTAAQGAKALGSSFGGVKNCGQPGQPPCPPGGAKISPKKKPAAGPPRLG